MVLQVNCAVCNCAVDCAVQLCYELRCAIVLELEWSSCLGPPAPIPEHYMPNAILHHWAAVQEPGVGWLANVATLKAALTARCTCSQQNLASPVNA